MPSPRPLPQRPARTALGADRVSTGARRAPPLRRASSATGAGWSASGWAGCATRWSARPPAPTTGGWPRGAARPSASATRCSRRLSTLGPEILETPDVEATRLELKRLLVDIQRHVQRLNDLAYDEVELELGGSE